VPSALVRADVFCLGSKSRFSDQFMQNIENMGVNLESSILASQNIELKDFIGKILKWWHLVEGSCSTPLAEFILKSLNPSILL
jgi:hypothetical protein